MSFEIKVDHKKSVFEIYSNGELLTTLSQMSSVDLYDSLRELVLDSEYLYHPKWAQITSADIDPYHYDESKQRKTLQDIIGIKIEMTWDEDDYNFIHQIDIKGMVDENPKNDIEFDTNEIYDNFPKERFLSEGFINHELRRTFSNEIIEHISTTPGFLIYYNRKKIDLENFLNENKTARYSSGHCYDVLGVHR